MKQFDAWGKIDGLLRDLQLGFADADLEKRFWARQWTQARALGIFTATVGVLIVSAHGVTGALRPSPPARREQLLAFSAAARELTIFFSAQGC